MIIILENDISIPNKNLNYLVNIFKKYFKLLDFRLEYIPQGYGCGLKFSLVSNYNGNE